MVMKARTKLPFRAELTAIDHNAERPRVFGFRVEHDEWQNVAVPAADEGNDADRRDNGPRKRHGECQKNFR